MRWLAWRQQRLVLAVLAVVDAALCLWGWHQSRIYAQATQLRCPGFGDNLTFRSGSAKCLSLVHSAFSVEGRFNSIAGAALAFSVLAGVILASTLIVTEFDRSTIRLSWSQSQTRTKWFAWAWLGGALSVAVLALPLVMVLGYWPAVTHIDNIGLTGSGGMLIVYGLLAFSLTGLVGVVVRRSGWSIVVSLALALGVWLAMGSLEQHYFEEPTAVYSLSQTGAFEPSPFALWIYGGQAPYKPGVVPSMYSMGTTRNELDVCEPMAQRGTEPFPAACWEKYHAARVWIFVPPTQLALLVTEESAILGGLIIATGIASAIIVRRMSV